ncbi:hypothetical protein [Thalassotalea sp. SU-HH00458]|uniref:hypothetical protein n=1 Tax=Thalassotalea sp. SU-HH00458 TaxID=3127657 RepID=UPI00310A3558
MNKLKLLFIAVIAFALTACGSSADDSSVETGKIGANPDSSSYVSGDFKHSSTSGYHYPEFYISSCVSALDGYYFESENVLVFGLQNYGEDDFKNAATLVDNNLSSAFSEMGITKSDLDAYRPKYDRSVARNTIINYLSGYSLNGVDYSTGDVDSDFVYPVGWETMSDEDKYAYYVAYWNSLSDQKHDELVSGFFALYPANYENYIVSKKIIVCLDERMGDGGEATVLGMNIGPKSSGGTTNSALVLHELIHMIQKNIANPLDESERLLDRWFSEGQAVYLSGQKTATSVNGQTPVHVKTIVDENAYFSSPGLAYEHYGLAYKYLAEYNPKESMVSLLEDIRYYRKADTSYMLNNSSKDSFRYAFDENMKKADGTQLTLDEYENYYGSFH